MDVKSKYLSLLNSFRDESIKTKEDEHLLLLSLLLPEEDKKYIHMPVMGERAKREVLDEAFTTLELNHKAIEYALSKLVDSTNKLEEEILVNDAKLNALLDVLKTELTVLALSTPGQEPYEHQIIENFEWPLTLAIESEEDKTYLASSVEWSPNDPTSITWIGDLSAGLDSKEAYVRIGELLEGNTITVQTVAWKSTGGTQLSDALIEALTAALAGLTDGISIDPRDFSIVSQIGADTDPSFNPDGSGMLKIILDTPTMLSRVGITTFPPESVDYVLVVNHQGVQTMYEMIDSNAYILTTVVKEIHFHITGGIASDSMNAVFNTLLEFEDISGGSLHVSGIFTDKVSHKITNTDIKLSGRPGERQKELLAAKKSIMDKKRIKSNKILAPDVGDSRAKSMVKGLDLSTARENLSTDTGDTRSTKPIPGPKSGSNNSKSDASVLSPARAARDARRSTVNPSKAVPKPARLKKPSNNTSNTKDTGNGS